MLSLDYLIGDASVSSFCKWLLIIFLVLNISHAFQNVTKKGTGYFLLFVIMLIYSVLYSPETGDNFTSMGNYYSYLNGTDIKNLHFERIYFYIMDLVPFGYVYYRLIVWGAACLLCVWLMKKLEIKSQIATLSILTFALPILLYYQRAAFAYVLLYVSLLCFLTNGSLLGKLPIYGKYYKLISVALLLCTIPFHTTMPIYVTFLLCALFVPKNRFGMLVLCAGLLLFSLSLISNSISLLELFKEDTVETGMRSLDGDTEIVNKNINGVMADFLHWLPLRAMVLFGLYKMLRYPGHQTTFEKVCLVNVFILLAVSIMFMQYSHVIQIKFTNAAMMPWTLYIASYFNRYVGSKTCSYYALATIFTFFV